MFRQGILEAFSVEQGVLESTQNPLDLAIGNEGYFVIQPKDGSPALSRRGDLQTSENGELLDGAGNQMLDDGLQPIVVPAFREITISPQGEVLFNQLVVNLEGCQFQLEF